MSQSIGLPELLAPAGNYEKMVSALHYGADAVYLAGQRFGMRAAADNFSYEDLARAIQFAHNLEKKVYVTVNVMPRERELEQLKDHLVSLAAASPDALIVADLGVLSLCKKYAPEVPIHISTQAATVNSEACKMWCELGAKRIVLARELSLSDISAIRDHIPTELELETFVHGSMCVSFSGRCMLSEYYTGRDANRGECTQPCRWQYHFSEEKRPNDVLTCEVWPEGSYLFGSKDLCMIRHLHELRCAGISSFKIEGRMKSSYYTAVVSNAYRIALDHPEYSDTDMMDLLMAELESVSHREYCTGYYFDPDMMHSNMASTNGYIGEQTYLCSVIDVDSTNGLAVCKQVNKFSVGDRCQFISPGQLGRDVNILQMYDESGNPIPSCPHPQMIFKIKTDQPLKIGDLLRKFK